MAIDFPSGRQTFDFDCGAKALQLVLAYYGSDIPEAKLIDELKCSTEGTASKNIIAVAEKHGFKVHAKCNFTLSKIKEYIDNNVPVIVLIQAWAKKPMTLEEWKLDYDDGHYAVVVDHYGSILVFEDPASFCKTWMTEREFLARWHDRDPASQAQLEHFGMAFLGKEPYPKHRILEHMD